MSTTAGRWSGCRPSGRGPSRTCSRLEKDISSDAPTKEGLPKELQRILNTLTEDAQRAAIRKCTDSVSISLDPYQKLVGGLVDKAQPEEIAKYTAFIIESVNRVFTPPTEPAFEGSRSQRNYTERIIKAVGGVVKPLAQGLKR